MTKLTQKTWRLATLIALSVIVFIQLGHLNGISYGISYGEKNILIINSYDRNNPWTATEEEGIVKGLNNVQGQFELYHEYMDTKRVLGSDYDEIFTAYLSKKYQDIKIDIVVTTDDYATNYVQSNKLKLFNENTPVVFVGLNNLEFKDSNFVGVYEKVDIRGTVQLIKEIHGDKTPIMIVTDETISSKSILSNISDDENWLSSNRITVVSDSELLTLRQKLSNFRNGVVLFLLFNQDSNGNVYNYFDGLNIIKESTALPIYSVWDFYIGYGVVGGSMITKDEMGKEVSDLLVRLINGADVKDLVSVETRAELIIDYPIMKHFGLDDSKIRVKSKIINQPTGFWNENFELILVFVFVVIVFMIIIILLVNNIRQKNQYYKIVGEHKNEILQTNQKLEKKLQDTQTAMKELQGRNDALVELILDLKKRVGFTEKIPFILHEINSILGMINSSILSMNSQSQRIEKNEANASPQYQFDELRELISDSLVHCELGIENAIHLVGATKTCYSDLSGSDERNYKIAGFVEAFWTMLKPTLKKKNIEFIMKVPEELSVFGNPGDFLTILAILFGNSLRHGYPKHSDKAMKIELEAYSSHNTIHIIYRDDGEGCVTEKLEEALRISVERAVANKSGIGLYQMNAIVTEKMQGNVIISGDVDEGISVRINIPKAGV